MEIYFVVKKIIKKSAKNFDNEKKTYTFALKNLLTLTLLKLWLTLLMTIAWLVVLVLGNVLWKQFRKETFMLLTQQFVLLAALVQRFVLRKQFIRNKKSYIRIQRRRGFASSFFGWLIR
jgi:hypothetical protein